ncbi:MAG: Maf family protein [Alphaproteobacteria bacterium]|nr:Maf family protein [Alphaproteobacteria bacterium]MBL6776299.1 Maf family protein [Alphaproteobacteria bacterium]
MAGWAITKHKIYLASASQTRVHLLRSAGLVFDAKAAPIDEEAIKQAGLAENVPPDDIAITLAELKAQKLASQKEGYIIGCDQLLSCEGAIFSKPRSEQEAAQHLEKLSGKTHRLHNAVVVFQAGRRIWHHCSHADLTMRKLTAQDIADYLAFCGSDCLSSPGCYQIEAGGAQLFSEIKGVYYDILGLPLLPLLQLLRAHGLMAIDGEAGK